MECFPVMHPDRVPFLQHAIIGLRSHLDLTWINIQRPCTRI